RDAFDQLEEAASNEIDRARALASRADRARRAGQNHWKRLSMMSHNQRRLLIHPDRAAFRAGFKAAIAKAQDDVNAELNTLRGEIGELRQAVAENVSLKEKLAISERCLTDTLGALQTVLAARRAAEEAKADLTKLHRQHAVERALEVVRDPAALLN